MNKLHNVYAAALTLFACSAAAHELTPTYPEIRPSYINGVSVTTMQMWNRRSDALYYEVNVFDSEWNPIPFATPNRILYMGYLSHISFDIYIRDNDINKISYICTTSKQLKEDVISTGIKSKICSRIK
jgi:hypothetical protein